ncbi:MAG: ATP-dependent RecD-like DNA helicase [Ruminococcus sp.]|nr:ATP-dependent RecD-like DNA helicase [Ruminococcus sp.]
MADDMLHIEGTVEEVLFRSESNGYIVFELDAGGELITVAGELGDISDGENLVVEGKYSTHRKYGTQFSAEYCERKLPDSTVNIEKYLASGAIKGIGKRLAEKITGVFGEKTLDIIQNEPQRLTEVKGISPDRAKAIAEESRKIFSLRMISAFLAQHEIKFGFAMKAYLKFGADTLDIIKENPYVLCDDGIELDFKKADTIAYNLDMERNSDRRITAGIRHILKTNTQCGHTCLPLDFVMGKAVSVLNITEDDFLKSYDSAVEYEEVFEYEKNNRRYICLPEYYHAERFISERIDAMKNIRARHIIEDCDLVISLEERKNRIKYGNLQRKAIKTALSENIMILTGGPGTGKTTTLNAIISLCKMYGAKVMLSAPTGRATKRMYDLTGYEARTIHRLLEMKYNSDGRLEFVHNEKNPVDCDLLVLDETSMVDVLLFSSLLHALKPECRLVITGDSDQLPSVGAGNVLRDLIDSGAVPVITLREIFRQSEKSCIVTNAHRIVSGEYPDLTKKNSDFFFFRRAEPENALNLISELVAKRLPKAYKYSPFDDIQVIAPSRKGILGTVSLNRTLQEKINPPSEDKPEIKSAEYIFRLGDKVMQTKNNYDIEWERNGEEGTGIFNGDIGIITEINRYESYMVIEFDGRSAVYDFEQLTEIELAYAVTVHKSQGCEFEAVIMPLQSGFAKLSYRNLLYTAVTRAKRLFILIGSATLVHGMVDNNRKSLRYTCLKNMLAEKQKERNDKENV